MITNENRVQDFFLHINSIKTKLNKRFSSQILMMDFEFFDSP